MKALGLFTMIGLVLGATYFGVSHGYPIHGHDDGSIVAANDIRTMVQMSEVIVVGTVVAEAGVRNTARDPNDPSRPHPDLIVNTRFYDFSVESVLKGTLTASKISVGSSYSSSLKRGPWTDEYRNDNFVPLTVGTRYALMLRADQFEAGSYALAFEPSRFELGTMATVRSALPDAKRNFPDLPTEAFISSLRSAVLAGH